MEYNEDFINEMKRIQEEKSIYLKDFKDLMCFLWRK